MRALVSTASNDIACEKLTLLLVVVVFFGFVMLYYVNITFVQQVFI